MKLDHPKGQGEDLDKGQDAKLGHPKGQSKDLSHPKGRDEGRVTLMEKVTSWVSFVDTV